MSNYTNNVLASQDHILKSFLDNFQKLTPSERRIWKVIQKWSQKYISNFLSQQTIAALSKCSDRTVRRAISKFKKYGWLQVIQRAYRSCIYKIKKILLYLDVSIKKIFLKIEKRNTVKNEKVLHFAKTFNEKFSYTQKRIFLQLQKRAKFRFPFFSIKELSQCCACSKSAVFNFLKKFGKSFGFLKIRRAWLPSSFTIHSNLIDFDLNDKNNFLMQTYDLKNTDYAQSTTRALQIYASKQLLKNLPLENKDIQIIARYNPKFLRYAIEDYKSYKLRHKVDNLPAFLISRCKIYRNKEKIVTNNQQAHEQTSINKENIIPKDLIVIRNKLFAKEVATTYNIGIQKEKNKAYIEPSDHILYLAYPSEGDYRFGLLEYTATNFEAKLKSFMSLYQLNIS